MHNLCVRSRAEFVCVWCLFACKGYGLVTGTCPHSSTARGHLSKNSRNPASVFVLPSILSPFWPRLEGMVVGGMLGGNEQFQLPTYQKQTYMTTSGPACGVTSCCCWLRSYTCTHVHVQKDTHTIYWGKHHATTKTHNCSPVENLSTFIDFFSTATRSSFGSCFIREFFYAALMQLSLLKSRRVISLCKESKKKTFLCKSRGLRAASAEDSFITFFWPCTVTSY